jgi:hypothetical protein
MTNPNTNGFGYYDKYYGQLVGAKITAYWESDDGFPTFGLVHPKLGAMVIEVSQDPEGNGEGFLFITDQKSQQVAS